MLVCSWELIVSTNAVLYTDMVRCLLMFLLLHAKSNYMVRNVSVWLEEYRYGYKNIDMVRNISIWLQ
jgi:hypothetical protein